MSKYSDKKGQPKGKSSKGKRNGAELPWVNPDEPDAPYHPSAKLGVLQITPKSLNQKTYLDAIDSYDVVFSTGPAGSGKSFLAVAKAVQWLAKKGNKLILTRPAVEAGEKLGYLPGDMNQKLDVYIAPLWASLREFLGPERVDRYVEMGIIQIAPLAYLRGVTFKESMVILDEAQNTTDKQMLLFLTRLGENSKMVINGDPSQIDLPPNQKSGLIDAQEILADVRSIKFCTFDDSDIVRHPIVSEIVAAYKKAKEKK